MDIDTQPSNYKGKNISFEVENGYRTLFAGSNEHSEIETLEEFFLKTDNQKDILLKGWNFQAVDFSLMSLEQWNSYNWNGAVFMGCFFPEGVTPKKTKKNSMSSLGKSNRCPFYNIQSSHVQARGNGKKRCYYWKILSRKY